MTRRFLGPHDRFVLEHRHEATPLEAMKCAFEVWGVRAPLVALQFCALCLTICAETTVPSRFAAQQRHGEAELMRCAADTGVAEATLRALLDAGPEPTHASFRRTFMRLYCDRVLAALAVPTGLLASAMLGVPGSAALSAASLAYVTASLMRSGNRYSNRMPDHLRAGADLVRRLTGAKLVIFGHTHREDEADGYVNSGSFGYTERVERPFVSVDEHGRVTRRFLPAC